LYKELEDMHSKLGNLDRFFKSADPFCCIASDRLYGVNGEVLEIVPLYKINNSRFVQILTRFQNCNTL